MAGSLDPSILAKLTTMLQNYRPGETAQPGFTDASGRSYVAGVTQGPYGGEGSTPAISSNGQYYVGNYTQQAGGDMSIYDSTGKDTGQKTHWDANSWDYDALAMAAMGAFVGGFAALAASAGEAGAVGAATSDTAGGSSAASAADYVNGMDLASDATTSAGGGAGSAAGASDYGYVNGMDGASDAATSSGTVGDGYINSGVSTTGGAAPGNMGAGTGVDPSTFPGGTTPTPGGSTTGIPKIPTIPGAGGGSTGGTNTNGGFDINSLMQLLTGAYGANQQEHSSQAMIDYLKSRQDINDKMYSTGSPEFNSMWDEMSRKDAAAGRNSQYGPRSVDLASHIAGLKMDANTKLTSGIGNFMANALNQKANAGINLTSLIPGILNSAGGNGINLSNLTNWINQQNGGGTFNGGQNDTGIVTNPSDPGFIGPPDFVGPPG